MKLYGLTLLAVIAACHCSLAQDAYTSSRLDMKGRRLKVVTVEEVPFSMLVNKTYRGYYIDILKMLAKELNFTYDLYSVADGRYGYQLPNGSWTGLIADVINGKADFALAPLRITANREKFVDFTVSVSSSGMSIVIKRPMAAPATDPSLFLRPFAPSTWILLILFYLIYSGAAFTIWLLSPYELGHTDHGQMPYLRKAKKSACSGWLLITGGVFVQGFARTPKAPSARILACVWWLFTLVSVCCYIANMVPIINSMHAAQALDLPFESLDEMVAQTNVPYGVLKGGASFSMLKDSSLTSFQRAHKYLTDRPDSLVDSVADGIARAKTGNYAFLAESLSAEYHTSVNCDLTTAATGITQLDFALALKKNRLGTDSDLRCLLNEAILNLKTSGQMNAMKSVWWTSGVDCAGSRSGRSAALMPGDFVCLYAIGFIGCLLALLALPAEMLLKGTMPKLPKRSAAAAAAAAATAAPAESLGPGPSGVSAAPAPAPAAADSEPEKKPLV